MHFWADRWIEEHLSLLILRAMGIFLVIFHQRVNPTDKCALMFCPKKIPHKKTAIILCTLCLFTFPHTYCKGSSRIGIDQKKYIFSFCFSVCYEQFKCFLNPIFFYPFSSISSSLIWHITRLRARESKKKRR